VKACVLDTHAFLWYVKGRRLGRSAGRLLREVDRGRCRAWIPVIVPLEVALLRERGRSAIGIPELEATLARNAELQVLALDLAQAREFALLPGVRDPFDRMIMAAARTVGCPLLSADTGIQESGLLQVVWD
jgi:PIN domain nuclease of toxin-antitoxin system